MRYTILFSIILFFFISCKKDKYTSTPQLKYKSVNNKVIRQGDILTFTLSFTDAEGDLQDSFYIGKFEPRCPASTVSQLYKLPDFPTNKKQSGEIVISFGYNVAGYPFIPSPQCNKNDTAVFKFVLKDNAKNKSDTAYSESIVIIK